MGTNKASALGRTNGGGPVDANAAVQMFMTGTGGSAATSTTSKANKRGLADLLGGMLAFHILIMSKFFMY